MSAAQPLRPGCQIGSIDIVQLAINAMGDEEVEEIVKEEPVAVPWKRHPGWRPNNVET